MSSRVSIAEEAQKHLAAIDERAKETGSGLFDVVLDELLHVIDLLEIHPEMGPAYPLVEGDLTRRVYLERSKHFAYYEYDPGRDTVCPGHGVDYLDLVRRPRRNARAARSTKERQALTRWRRTRAGRRARAFGASRRVVLPRGGQAAGRVPR